MYFDKNRADVRSRSIYLRAYRKDLELISKAGSCLPGQMVCDTIERLSCLLAAVKLKCKTRDYRPDGLLAFCIWVLADICDFWSSRLSKDKEKSRWGGLSVLAQLHKSAKSPVQTKRKRI